MVLEHLLEVRHAPVLRRGVAEEAALDVVVGAAAGHLLQRVEGHALQRIVGTDHRLLEEQEQRLGLRKLGRAAEAPVLLVIGGANGIEDLVDESGSEVSRAARDARSRALARLQHPARNLGLAGPVVACDPDQRARHLVGRHICRPGEDVARRGQERGRRPTTHVVALVDVGPDVVVDSHRHVVAVDEIDHARVRVRRLVHDVAPVAPHRRDGEKDGAPGRASLVERLLRPGMPVDLGRAVGPWREVKLLRSFTHEAKVTMRS